MNLYFRLFFTLFFSGFKKKHSLIKECRTDHRVLPNDLDVFGHMTNSRYFAIADLVRTELLIRAGQLKQFRTKRYTPLVASEFAQFKKSLKPFQKYQVQTKTVAWDKKCSYIEQRFVSAKGLHAILFIKICVVAPGGKKISPAEILRLEDKDIALENMHEAIHHWSNVFETQT